jgi:hypothetical protein
MKDYDTSQIKNHPPMILSDLMDGYSTVDFQWFLIT